MDGSLMFIRVLARSVDFYSSLLAARVALPWHTVEMLTVVAVVKAVPSGCRG